MAGWLHGVCVGACWVVSPPDGFSFSLFCSKQSYRSACCTKLVFKRLHVVAKHVQHPETMLDYKCRTKPTTH